MKRNSQGSVAARFLRPEQIDEVLEEVHVHSADEGVSVAIVGGVAMQLYGSDRFTKDVDVVADRQLSGTPGPALSFGGVKTTASNGSPLDIILRNDEYAPLYDDALYMARKVRGVPLRVATLEHMAAMKLASARGKDLDDLAFLVLHTDLNQKKARKLIVKYLGLYAGREFDRFVTEVTALGGRA